MKRSILALALALVVTSGIAVADPIAFEPARPLDLGGGADLVTVVDLDGDGILDVVKTNEKGRGLTALLNRGDATFAARPVIMPDYRSVYPAVVGDVDADGDQDLLLALLHYVGDTSQIDEKRLTLLLNDGSGGLTPSTLAESLAAWTPVSLVDMDGDGDLDIGYAWSYIDGFSAYALLENDASGNFTAKPSIPLSQDYFDFVDDAAFMGDLGTDGLPELYVSLRHSGGAILRNSGSMSFQPPTIISSKDGGPAVFADVTGDGYKDIVRGLPARVGVWTGTDDGWLSDYNVYGSDSSRGSAGFFPFCVADFDGDGDRDAAVPSYLGEVSIFTNPGDGHFEMNHEVRLGTSDSYNLRQVSFGRFDDSGSNKLLVHSDQGTWLLTTGGLPPPTITSVEPTILAGGQTHELTVTGAGFAAGTTVDLGEWFDILDVQVDSPERLVATVGVRHWDFDTGTNYSGDGEFDAIVRGPSGGSSRIINAVEVPPYWSFELGYPNGSLKDRRKPGRDSFKARGKLRFPDWREFYDRAGSDLRLVVGSKGATWEMTIPGHDRGWRLTRKNGYIQKMSWKSPRGATPKVKLSITHKTKNRNWQVSVKRFDFPGAQDETIRVELHMGEVRAASIVEWIPSGEGRFTR